MQTGKEGQITKGETIIIATITAITVNYRK